MIEAISTPQIQQGATGKYAKVMCQFRSDESLTGEVLRFYPAVWDTPTANPSAISWQIIYPGSTGTSYTELDYVGSNVNQNWQASIRVLDNKNFIICYEYFWLTDINGYIGDQTYNNHLIFTQSNGLGSSVYTAQDSLTLTVQVNANYASCPMPAQGNAFCLGDMLFNLAIDEDGFTPGEDFEIGLSTSNPGISNNFYVGFIQKDSISNTLNFVTDYNLHYGLVSNGVAAITPIGSETIPVDCFASANGFVYNSYGFALAQVTISGSCLVAGSEYQIYVVYQENGEWKSCLSPIYGQTGSERDLIEASISCELTDAIGNIYSDCCVTGLAKLGEIKVCMSLDRASLEANIAAAGLDGTLDDYFEIAAITMSSVEPQDETEVGGSVINTGYTIDTNGITVCATYTPNDNDSYLYFTASFQFNYGTELNPDRDYHYVVQQVAFTGTTTPIDPTITLDGVTITEDFICAENGGILDFSSVGADEYYLGFGLNGGFTVLDGSSIDSELLALDTEYCIKAITNGSSITTTPPDCECPECTDVQYQVFAEEDPYDSIIDFTVPDGYTITVNGVSGTGGVSFGGNSGLNFNYWLRIERNGCIWEDTGHIQNDIDETVTLVGSGNETDCDCPEDDECEENQIWITSECDEETGSITWSHQDSLTSAVDEDLQSDNEETLEDGTTKIYITRKVTFTDGCPAIELDQVLECKVLKICNNNREVEYEIVECQLELTFDETFDSERIEDILLVSIDGGTNFEEFDMLTDGYTAIDITSSEIDLILQWDIKFDDGCLDLQGLVSDQITIEQENERIIDFDASTGLVVLIFTDNFVAYDTVVTDTLYLELNGTITEYDQLTDAYTDDLDVTDGDEVCYWTLTTFEKCSPDLEIERVCEIIGQDDPTDCAGYDGYSIDCSYDEETGIFTLNYTGDPLQLTSSPMFPVFTLGNGINPLDNNNSGTPVPNTEFEITGEGLLIYAWKLLKPNCEEKTIYTTCFGKPCIEICNFDGLEIPTPEVTVNIEAPIVNVDIDACCCDVEAGTAAPMPCGCDETIDLNTLVLGGDSGGTWTIDAASPSGNTITISGSTVDFTDQPAGIYYFTYEVTGSTPEGGECSDTVTVSYEQFEKPDLGDPSPIAGK